MQHKRFFQLITKFNCNTNIDVVTFFGDERVLNLNDVFSQLTTIIVGFLRKMSHIIISYFVNYMK